MRKTRSDRQEFDHHLVICRVGVHRKGHAHSLHAGGRGLHFQVKRFTLASSRGDLGDLKHALAGCPQHRDRFGVLTCNHNPALDTPVQGGSSCARCRVNLLVPCGDGRRAHDVQIQQELTFFGVVERRLGIEVACMDAHAAQATVLTRTVVGRSPRWLKLHANASVHPPLA